MRIPEIDRLPAFTDYRKMLEEFRGKIDICFIPTGIAMHCPMTVAALESGANVYVEKPVAPTVEETEIMKEAEKRTGRFVAVGYQTMYQPETRRIKELLLSGAIGTPRIFKSYALWPRNDAYYSATTGRACFLSTANGFLTARSRMRSPTF